MKRYVKICALILALGQVVVWSGGCASSQAGRAAGEGAALGAVGGAVAGAVGALIFGGNVAQSAAAGAAIGAASGAATGAVSGAMADSKVKDQQAKERQLEELKEKIGDPEQRLFALYIQAVAAEESGDQRSASSAYAQAIQDDPSRGPEEKIRAKCLEGVMKAQKVRQDHGLPPLCK
jgi:uncharacterized membrane protein